MQIGSSMNDSSSSAAVSASSVPFVSASGAQSYVVQQNRSRASQIGTHDFQFGMPNNAQNAGGSNNLVGYSNSPKRGSSIAKNNMISDVNSSQEIGGGAEMSSAMPTSTMNAGQSFMIV